MIYGLTSAILHQWACDDAFISYRYAENLIEGRGLVYNEGEYVQGYSNLLWTVLIAAGNKIGSGSKESSILLGFISYVLLVFCLFVRCRQQSATGGKPVFPLAAGLALISSDFHVWATGGLETMFFTLLATTAVLLTRIEKKGLSVPIYAGLLFSLVILTRLDGLLFAAVGALSWFVPFDRTNPGRQLVRCTAMLIPLGITLAFYTAFSLTYYGDFFPTPFYSKSATSSNVSQGVLYIALYLAKNWYLIIAAVGILILLKQKTLNLEKQKRGDIVIFAAAFFLYNAYLVYVGGDFMFARRIVPTVPFLFLILEDISATLKTYRGHIILCLVILGGAVFTFPVYGRETNRVFGIADEKAFYPEMVLEVRKKQARLVSSSLQTSSEVKVAFEGGMCSFGYYSKLPYLVEITGLTQYSLAKQPIRKRGMIGHEKLADDTWYRNNGIHFLVRQTFPDQIRREKKWRALSDIYWSDFAKGRILFYSDKIMERLEKNPRVAFIPIEQAIGICRKQIKDCSAQDAKKILSWLDRYYFRNGNSKAVDQRKELAELVKAKAID